MFVQGQDVRHSSPIYLYVDTLVEELCQEVTILVLVLGTGSTTQIANCYLPFDLYLCLCFLLGLEKLYAFLC